MKGANTETVLLQRFVKDRDFALAVAKDNRVLQVLRVTQKLTQQFTLRVRFFAGGYLGLRDGDSGRCWLRDLDLFRIVQEGLGDTSDFSRHSRGFVLVFFFVFFF